MDLYTFIYIIFASWGSRSMDFILGLPRALRRHHSILTLVDRFSKMTHSIPCIDAIDASHIARCFLGGLIARYP